MPKKQVRNAFYFFMKDLEPQLKREGRVFPHGLQDVVPIAHPRWKVMISSLFSSFTTENLQLDEGYFPAHAWHDNFFLN